MHSNHRTPSLTGEPLLLHRGVLHRVDSTQLTERDGVAVGACCNQDCSQGDTCPQRPQQPARPGLLRPALQWLATAAVFVVLALATVVMGKPQDH